MAEVKLHYFKGRGRAETTRWMLAANAIPFENAPVLTPGDLGALRASGKPPFGQLPVLEIDGMCLSQSTAMLRYLARKGGFYGDTDEERVWIDMTAGAVADFAETVMQAPFQPDAAAVTRSLSAAVAKFGPHFERRLAATGGLVAGSRMSFADIVMAEALEHYLEWEPDVLAGYPRMAALRRRVVAEPGIAAYLASPERYERPGARYVIDVARVLQRALPGHMPDPDRFVR